MRKQNKWMIAASVSLTLVAAGIVVGRAWAVGIPSSKPFTYSGLLQNADGSPFTGSGHALEIKLWNDGSATATTNLLCDTGSQTLTTDATGHFSLSLGDDCTKGVADSKETYVEILLDGQVLGGKRSRLGAVPYAIEAKHAMSAESAAQATAASTAGNATTADMAMKAAALSGPVVVKELASDNLQQGTFGTDLVYDGVSVDLTPGTWLVEASASVATTDVSDGVAVGLYNATTAQDIPDSRSGVCQADGLCGLHTSKILIATTNMTIRLKAFRNGASTLQFGAPAPFVMKGGRHRIVAVQLSTSVP